jgi:hypothetical protein
MPLTEAFCNSAQSILNKNGYSGKFAEGFPPEPQRIPVGVVKAEIQASDRAVPEFAGCFMGRTGRSSANSSGKSTMAQDLIC